MRERRRPLGGVVELFEELAAGVRRRQREREPRVVLYDPAGRPRVLPPGDEDRERLLETAGEMIELAERGPA